MSKLAVHLIPEHMDFSGLREWQPKSIKIINPDFERCKRVYELCPDALYVLRSHPISEQHDDMFRDPEGTGERHARELADLGQRVAPMIPRGQRVYTGINEPHLWSARLANGIDIPLSGRQVTLLTAHTNGLTRSVITINHLLLVAQATGDTYLEQQAREALDFTLTRVTRSEVQALRIYPYGVECTDRYYGAFGRTLTALGERGGLANFSVGWPANTGTDTPPDWSGFTRMKATLDADPRHFLVLHEYWCKLGPAYMWRWWAGRYLQCPWQVPIIIGECGLDQYVQGPVGFEGRGWSANVSQDEYLAQLKWYDAELMKDARIHSAQIFTSDCGAPWQTFDLRPLHRRIADYAKQTPQPKPPTPEPNPTDLRTVLLAAGERHQLIQFNPQAALQKVIFPDGFCINSPEFDVTLDGVTYRGQRAERLSDGAVRVYFAELGQWHLVRYVQK
jgi:hypothetical protein